MGAFPDFTKIALPGADQINAALGEVPPAHLNAEQLPLPALGCADACLLYTSPSPRDRTRSRMPSSA